MIPGEAPEGIVPPSTSMATPKPRIVVHESDACQGNITGWDCDDCEDDDCEHECHQDEPTGDLRERLDAALRTVGLARNLAAYRDAVLPVVEAETAAKDAEIKRLGSEWIAAHNRATRNRQRAEKAERRAEHFEEHAAQINADLGIETQRAEDAEDRLRKAEQAYTQLAAVADDAVAARDRWRTRAEEAEAHAAYLDQDVIKPERALHEQTIKRAGNAERQRDEALATVERVRRLQEMTIASSCRVQAIDQARDTLRVLERPKETP